MDNLRYRYKAKLPSPKAMRSDGLKQKGYRFYKNIECGNCIVKLTTSKVCGQEFVNVELSAPKLVHGSNVAMVTGNDLDGLNDTVTTIVYQSAPCIPFEASEAEITRLDLAYNFQTGSETNAHAYRDALMTMTLPYLTRDICAKENGIETVYWSNKSREVLVYPKFSETQRLAKVGKVGARFLEQSRGMLRLEHRHLDADTVGNICAEFGYRNRAEDVVPHLIEMTHEVLQKNMALLGLDSPIVIAGERERADRLREKCYTFEQFNTLAGFLNLCDMYGEGNLVALGMNKGTFRNRKLALKKMGIPLTVSETRHVLPALSISNPFNKSEICSTASTLPDYIPDSTVYVDGIF